MKIDFLILDISFPEGNPLALLPSLKLAQPDMKVLIFSSFEEEIYGLRYLKAGADGYLSKLASPEDIQFALKTWVSKGSYVSPKLQEGIYHSVISGNSGNPLDVLSKREKEVAMLLVNGNGNLEISNALELQPTTVSTYKNRIFEKLGISNLSSLIAIFNLYHES
jgi:DNA-binding NarL/FixJ family response regulator